MAKYIKKPIVVEAEQFLRKDFDWRYIANPFYDGVYYNGNGEFAIKTFEGVMEVMDEDYIITGIRGEKYPCKPDIFEATYEKVIEDNE